MFRQLSFDTSKSDVHLALAEDATLVCEHVISVQDAASGTARQEAANLLIPGIDSIIREVGWSKSDIDCLIVGTGPGGFTGIRTAVVTARALAQALELPLYPVSILECIASVLPGEFSIVLYATMGHFFLAKGSAQGVECAYAATSEVAEFLGNMRDVYIDERAKSEIEAATNGTAVTEDVRRECREAVPDFLQAVRLADIPEIANIAAQQSKFAWPRLSLKVGAIYERLDQLHARDSSDDGRSKFRQELCREFPYDVVVPTYLRAPSVTLKKTNV